MAEVAVQKIAGAANPRLAVVFVHGLGGDARGTWTFEKKAREPGRIGRFLGQKPSPAASAFWPEWLAADVSGVEVYCVGYPADKMGWNAGWPIEEAAIAVLDRLMNNAGLRKSDAPIVFVCHSLGGIVVKQLVMKARAGGDLSERKRVFLDRIAGVVFLATPHDGSFLATAASAFDWVVTDTMRDLIANSAKLGNLSDDYRDFVAADGRLKHLIFYEKEKVGALVGVVSSGSANPGLAGAERVPIGRNHIDICKISERDDQVYEGVLAFLEDALGPRAPSTREVAEQTKDDTAAIRERLDKIAAAIDPALARRAEEEGLAKSVILRLAEKLRPDETLDIEQAVRELENAVTIALDVITKGERGTNEDDFVNAVLARVAALTRQGDFDKGAREVDGALAELDRREAEQQEALRRARVTLLETGVEQDMLRRDFRSAAARVARIVDQETSDSAARFEALRRRQSAYFVEGRDKGVNSSLGIAIELARLMTPRGNHPRT